MIQMHMHQIVNNRAEEILIHTIQNQNEKDTMAGKRRGSRGRGGKALKPAQTSPGLATTQAPAGRPRHGRPIVDADAKRALKSLLGQAAAQRGQVSCHILPCLVDT